MNRQLKPMKRPFRGSIARTALLFWVCLASTSLWASAEINVQVVKDAITTINQLPTQIRSATTTAQSIPLGPTSLRETCCQAKFIWCLNEVTYGYIVDFNHARDFFLKKFGVAARHADGFSSSFGPVIAWKAGVPALSQQFDQVAGSIAGLQARMQQGKAVSAAARATVNAQISRLLNDLESSKQLLVEGRQTLAVFLQQQNQLNQDIEAASGEIKTEIEQRMNEIRDFIARQPCGHAFANVQLNSFRSQFTASSQRYQQLLDGLRKDTQNADNAVSVLIGTLTGSIASFQPIVQQLQAASDRNLAAALAVLRITVARSQWQDLAASIPQ